MNYFHTEHLDFLTSRNNPLFFSEANLIYQSIKFLSKEYPMFKEWYFLKVIPEIQSGHRTIIIKKDRLNNIIGLAIIKDGFGEKKICTLWVNDMFQNRGIGSDLIKNSIDFLENQSPLVTVSSSRIHQFSSLFDKFGFQKTEVHDSYYKTSVPELVFNGKLPDRETASSILLTDDILDTQPNTNYPMYTRIFG